MTIISISQSSATRNRCGLGEHCTIAGDEDATVWGEIRRELDAAREAA